MTSLADIRKSYERAELSEDASQADPLKQFEQWLSEAIAARVPEPNAMTLATVGSDASFETGRGQMELLAGIKVTTKAVERQAEAIGADIETRQQAEIARAKSGRPFPTAPSERGTS